MKKGKFRIMAGVLALVGTVLFAAAQPVHAAPGEGPYVGGFAGYGASQVSGKVTTASISTNAAGGTFDLAEGGLGLDGAQYGAWIGYGLRMGQLYGGIEVEYMGSEEEFEMTSSIALELEEGTTITKISAQKNYTWGPAFRLGYYVNKDTLFAIKGGVVATEFDVNAGYQSDTYTGFGPRYGASIETALFENLSLRMEYVVTDYLTAPVSGIGSDNLDRARADSASPDIEVTGMDYSGRLGLVLHF